MVSFERQTVAVNIGAGVTDCDLMRSVRGKLMTHTAGSLPDVFRSLNWHEVKQSQWHRCRWNFPLFFSLSLFSNFFNFQLLGHFRIFKLFLISNFNSDLNISEYREEGETRKLARLWRLAGLSNPKRSQLWMKTERSTFAGARFKFVSRDKFPQASSMNHGSRQINSLCLCVTSRPSLAHSYGM